MFNNNLKLALRHLIKYKTYSFINIFGMAVGLACALLIFLWVNDELHVDKFHEKDERLYQIRENQHHAESIQTTEGTTGLMAETLAKEMPEVEYAAQVAPAEWFAEVGDFTLSVGDKKIKSRGQFAGKDFFNVFSYNLVSGDADQVLQDKNAIVISEALAMKLFGTTEDVVGKTLAWHASKFSRPGQITGVFKGTPHNSSHQFDLVLSFEVFKEMNPGVLRWGNYGTRAYIVLHENTDVALFNAKISDIIERKNTEDRRKDDRKVFAQRYSDGYLYGKYENGEQAGGRIEYVRLFSIISLFILLIACINFMNLSTAKAARRMKEVGVKKTIGVGRRALVLQYLGESMLVTFLSLLLAILLVELLMPQFNALTGKQLVLNWGELVVPLLTITLFTGLIAGSYPALYLSGFNPVAILKGQLTISSGEVWTRKGLVVFQFAVSVFLIVSVLVVYKQVAFVQTKNLGYDKNNIIQFANEGEIAQKPLEFAAALQQIPGVVNASSLCQPLIGSLSTTTGLNWEGKDPDATIQFINMTSDYDLIETLGLELKEGRSFSREYGAEDTKIIFNEAAIKVMGLEEPVGKTINMWGKDKQIIGVVKDFHLESLHESFKPTLFRLDNDLLMTTMVKIEAGREKETIARIAEFYKSYNPGYVFDYRFLDQDYQALYVAEQRVSVLSRYFAGLAILISCLGLFGLAAFTAERRLQEIGIRKVLGSSVFGIVYLLSSDFTKMAFAAIVIALPISYLAAQNWLDDFAYRIDLEAWYFLSAGLATLFIAWLTVGAQALKAAIVSPVQCLRDE